MEKKLKVLKAEEAEAGKIYFDLDSQMYCESKNGAWVFLWKPMRQEEVVEAEEIIAVL